MGSMASANPMAMGIGAAASFAGAILSAQGPSRQMQALNNQVQGFTNDMTALAKNEGLSASTVFQNLLQPLQRIVQGGPQQAGWSNEQVSNYNAGVTNSSAATARDLGGLGTVSGGPGSSQAAVLAARQKAEDQRAAGVEAGTEKSFEAGREEFNTAVGEEKQLPGVFETANKGAEVAGNQQQLAEKSQQNIDTQKAAASVSGRIGGGLSAVGGALLGGKLAAPPNAPNIPDTGDITGNPMSGGSLPAGSGAAPTPPNIPNIVPGQP